MLVWKSLVHVVAPLLVGGLLYLLARPTNLLMFDWLESVGLLSTLEIARTLLAPFVPKTPNVLIDCVPNALWVYSLTSTMLLLWKGDTEPVSKVWTWVIPWSAALLPELGQVVHVVPGVFDVRDLVLSVLACAFSFTLLRNRTVYAEYC